MCRVCGCYRGGNCGDGCDFPSTLCRYDLRKGDLFVLSWRSSILMDPRCASTISKHAFTCVIIIAYLRDDMVF